MTSRTAKRWENKKKIQDKNRKFVVYNNGLVSLDFRIFKHVGYGFFFGLVRHLLDVLCTSLFQKSAVSTCLFIFEKKNIIFDGERRKKMYRRDRSYGGNNERWLWPKWTEVIGILGCIVRKLSSVCTRRERMVGGPISLNNFVNKKKRKELSSKYFEELIRNNNIMYVL